jgi:hypothetical protein
MPIPPPPEGTPGTNPLPSSMATAVYLVGSLAPNFLSLGQNALAVGWQSIIRRAFLLLVVIVQSRLALKARKRGQSEAA